jgi:hypothetical protein
MAIALSHHGNIVKLTLAGCTGSCSAGHEQFECYYWNFSDQTRVNVVGRLCVANIIEPECLDDMKRDFDNGFNKYPENCKAMIWTDWNRVFWMHESSGIDIWKYLIGRLLERNKKWIPCPKCVSSGRTFGEILYIDPSFRLCPDHKL